MVRREDEVVVQSCFPSIKKKSEISTECLLEAVSQSGVVFGWEMTSPKKRFCCLSVIEWGLHFEGKKF